MFQLIEKNPHHQDGKMDPRGKWGWEDIPESETVIASAQDRLGFFGRDLAGNTVVARAKALPGDKTLIESRVTLKKEGTQIDFAEVTFHMAERPIKGAQGIVIRTFPTIDITKN